MYFYHISFNSVNDQCYLTEARCLSLGMNNSKKEKVSVVLICANVWCLYLLMCGGNMFYFTLPNKWQTPSQCHQCACQSHPDPLKTSFHSLFSLYYALLLPNNNSTSNISALSLSNCSRMECQNSYIQVLRYVFWCQRHSVWAICQQSKRNLTTLFSHLSLSLFNRMDSMGVWPEVTLFIHITWYISQHYFKFHHFHWTLP